MSQNQEKTTLRQLLKTIDDRAGGVMVHGVSGAARAFVCMRVHQNGPHALLIVVDTAKHAERLSDALRFFMARHAARVLYFPPYHILPFQQLAYHTETAAQRIGTLYRLMYAESPPIVVTTIGALCQKLMPREALNRYAELTIAGEDIDREALIAKLEAGGYTRTAIVEEPGEYSVRGGILDIYSPLHTDPLRMEFFGDTVDSIRSFSPISQRTQQALDEAVILPACEAILAADQLPEILNRVREQGARLELPVTQMRALVDRIRHDGVIPGIEGLTPLVYSQMETLLDYIPRGSLPVVVEPAQLQQTAEEQLGAAEQNFRTACAQRQFSLEPQRLFDDWERVVDTLVSRNPLILQTLDVRGETDAFKRNTRHYMFRTEDHQALRAKVRHPAPGENLLQPLVHWIAAQQQKEMQVWVLSPSKTERERLRALLSPYAINLENCEAFVHRSSAKGRPTPVCLACGALQQGFTWPDEGLVVITAEDIFGKHPPRRRRAPAVDRRQLLQLADLKRDDLVVHDQHGIGRYQGLERLAIDGIANDFLRIEYRDEDKLYLPVERMNVLQKYLGVEGAQPVLDKMGGTSWERVKAKVKRSTEKIAGELLKLYATRKVKRGLAFSPVDTEMATFQIGFPYAETPDQQKAIEDVLMDMEALTPMDRLVCGDVGYGKTEVALRASFLAVYNGRQVAVLVPTTVLAEQHHATFSERFANYPVNIACLSRFRSRREQRQIIDRLKTGQIDIVIGTHRLLQKDIAFKALGLLVVDEEQRFGVKHKEKLKKLRQTVDVLALTATPIPRTLHLSLVGVRDISIISTPPEYRRAIITFVSEFDDAIVMEAIARERKRQGQIFFVHNHVQSIERMAEHLARLAPETRLAIAHGQMAENELEAVMVQFFNKEIDLLVCTSIIESGLDIPAANTILINRADRFGLAQIYQLRGRVGRSDEQAYAYLFIPRESYISTQARKRLKVLMEHSDLGSGFQIAMSDLQIRGGGTILGASQSGHIAAVGYDMFLKLMEESIRTLKGEPYQPPLDPEINLQASAVLPSSYIPDIDQRLFAYRRLSNMTRLTEITDFKAELVDRFGPLPVEARNLMLKIMLKVMAIQSGVQRLDVTARHLQLHFSMDHMRNAQGLIAMVQQHPQRFQLTPTHVLKARLQPGDLNGLVAQSKNILKDVIQCVNYR